MKHYKKVKATISRMLQELVEMIQPYSAAKLSCALECYNVTVEEEDKDTRKIDIPETEDQGEVQRPQIENPDITMPVKTKQVNIGIEAKTNFTNIRDYWDVATVDKVTELLCEYQDLFPTKFIDLKGIVRDLGVMRITLKPNAKPIK